ncbi:MAG: RNA methyltransferase [Bacteroidia bacterium]|nr:RNA methyltransferase [Bacteroidia bacterium]
MPRLPHPPEYYYRLQDAAHRRATGLFIAPGRKLLTEALRSLSLDRFHAILYDQAELPPFLPSPLNERAFPLPSWQIRRISGQETPDGFVTILRLPQPYLFPPFPPAVLVERLQDPGNLGTLIRSMEWLGWKHLWLTADSADPFSPKAVRASMGSLFRLNVQRTDRWDELLQGYEGRCIVAALKGIPAHEVDWSQYDSLYIGSEAHGVQRAPQRWPKVSIPPDPLSQAESLNAAVAAALLLYVQREVRAGRIHTSPPPPPF